jgi:hypothetical protein
MQIMTLALAVVAMVSSSSDPQASPIMKILADEINYNMAHLAMPDGTRPYYLSYTVTDRESLVQSAELGALIADNEDRSRALDIELRVGDYALDSSHKLRGGAGGGGFAGGGTVIVPMDNDPLALQRALWRGTDVRFKSAVQRYDRVLANIETMVEEEDLSSDFSQETAQASVEHPRPLQVDRAVWAQRIRRVSQLARQYPLIYSSTIAINAEVVHRYQVTSEGSRVQTAQKLLRVSVTASTRAEDGMNLNQYHSFDCTNEAGLPDEKTLRAALQEVIDQVLALRKAPIVEPYIGPAILVNRASGVFFHEIFGHRIEGHRQRDVEEGQTFTKKIGKPVLPDFLSVHDDPTRAKFGAVDLRGHYRFDDEGVPAQNVVLVDQGILRTFLLGRTPVAGFPKSNGHGRRAVGRDPVARQGNLVVHSTRQVPFNRLREMLVEECHKQGKPYGLLFEDISGGFTGTRRAGGQSFKVLPIVVYRVFADSRPDELVRGVDIVGTPLTCFNKILCTGDDPQVFNGTCGAESGWVPVSAVSPSILVSEIEIEKRQREQGRLPILPPPIGELEQH